MQSKNCCGSPHRAEPGPHNDSRRRDRGVTIPAGEKVLLLYGSANRDERAFGDDADELDVRATSTRC